MIRGDNFSEGLPSADLPLIYRYMAAFMQLKYYDGRVYSKGKGRMWRLPNKPRPGTGAHKVQISVAELIGMTPERYEELCSKPRPYHSAPEPEAKNQFLVALYERAVAKVADGPEFKDHFIDPEVLKKLNGELSPCMQMLGEGASLKPGAGFNAYAIQFAKGLYHFVPSGKEQDRLMRKFAESMEGDNYDTVEKRYNNVKSCLEAIRSNPAQYRWNCGRMLSVLELEPCGVCPVSFLRFDQDD